MCSLSISAPVVGFGFVRVEQEAESDMDCVLLFCYIFPINVAGRSNVGLPKMIFEHG